MKYNIIEGGVCASKGFFAFGMHCGLKKTSQKPDLALIYSEKVCSATSVYTLNKVKGAPINITKEHLIDGNAQAIIINSGNANTCNADGEEKAKKMCELVAKELNIKTTDIIVASTGIIGKVLPIEPIENAMSDLVKGLSSDGNKLASQAILTTDTFEKEFAVSFMLNDKKCVIGGMAKGSGMIHPNMATMLSFITTDVNISSELLQIALKDVVDKTFNMISVDGDTSTNDMVSILASNLSENQIINEINSPEYAIFTKALYLVLENLSKQIAKDGEGATKLLECNVSGAKSVEVARIIAKSVITSSLFKSAMFGEDPNWGRILCAIGYADAEFNIYGVSVELTSEIGSILVCQDGSGIDFDENFAISILKAKEVSVNIYLDAGLYKATAWGCDLSYDYIKINAEYHT